MNERSKCKKCTLNCDFGRIMILIQEGLTPDEALRAEIEIKKECKSEDFQKHGAIDKEEAA